MYWEQVFFWSGVLLSIHVSAVCAVVLSTSHLHSCNRDVWFRFYNPVRTAGPMDHVVRLFTVASTVDSWAAS